MKFLCGNCKAKYKIADDKVSGRALRMKCRRCQHDIIIRREEAAPPAAAAAAGGGRGAAARPKAPQAKRGDRRGGSALGADFRRNVSSPGAKSSPPPTPAPPEDLWHVAINDVPVGPIKREEVEKKVQTGAVNGESLCWREGYDDWRPLSEVAELASLLRKQRPPAPSRRPPVGRGIDRRHESRPRIRPVGAGSRPAPVPPPDNVVPIGGRLGGSAAPAVDLDDELLDEPTRVSASLFTLEEEEAAAGATVPDPRGPGAAPASVSPAPASVPPAADPLADMFAPPAPASMPAAPAPAAMPAAAAAPAMAPVRPSAAPPARRKRAIPVGAWIAIVAAGAFGITLAVFVGTNLMRGPADPAPVAVAPANPTGAEGPEPAAPEIDIDDEPTGEDVEAPEGEVDDAVGDGPGPRTTPRRGNGERRTPQTAGMSTTSMRPLSAEQQALLDRMGGSGSAGSNIVTTMSTEGSMAASGRQLTGDQLRSTVSSNTRSLRRCYELAIRGAGDPPTIRLDVQVTIAATGRVTRVSASGRDFGGMKACLETNVRRWRFPRGGATTQTQFPVVFQPQG